MINIDGGPNISISLDARSGAAIAPSAKKNINAAESSTLSSELAKSWAWAAATE